MAVEVWGQMAKAQDDSETIEEAIERIVAEHNADPISHDSPGESLALHKSQNQLDHFAGSVVNDKLTQTEYINFIDLASADGWYKTDYVFFGDEQDYISGCLFGILDGLSPQYAWAFPWNFGPFIDWEKDLMIQFSLGVNEDENYSFRIGLGPNHFGDYASGFGFTIENNVLKGYAVDDDDWIYTDPISHDVHDYSMYRVLYFAEDHHFEFWINGEKKAEILDWEYGVSVRHSRLAMYGEDNAGEAVFGASIGSIWLGRKL